jgi:hypothetical protein
VSARSSPTWRVPTRLEQIVVGLREGVCGGTSSVRHFASEFPFDVARRGHAVGSAVLEAVLPPHDGPTATVPVTMSDVGLEERDGVEAKTIILEQLAAALQVIGQQDPARITTLGGECSVSVGPFSELARRYGDDLAIFDSNEIVLGPAPNRTDSRVPKCGASSPTSTRPWMSSGSPSRSSFADM